MEASLYSFRADNKVSSHVAFSGLCDDGARAAVARHVSAGERLIALNHPAADFLWPTLAAVRADCVASGRQVVFVEKALLAGTFQLLRAIGAALEIPEEGRPPMPNGERIEAALEARDRPEDRIVVLVDDAHLLGLETLHFLYACAGLCVVLAGPPSLWALLKRERMTRGGCVRVLCGAAEATATEPRRRRISPAWAVAGIVPCFAVGVLLFAGNSWRHGVLARAPAMPVLASVAAPTTSKTVLAGLPGHSALPALAPPDLAEIPPRPTAPQLALAEPPPAAFAPVPVAEPILPTPAPNLPVLAPMLAMARLPAPEAEPHAKGAPGLMLVAERGDTLQTLYDRVYHGMTGPDFATVRASNPGPVQPGAILTFPAPPGGWPPPQ